MTMQTLFLLRLETVRRSLLMQRDDLPAVLPTLPLRSHQATTDRTLVIRLGSMTFCPCGRKKTATHDRCGRCREKAAFLPPTSKRHQRLRRSCACGRPTRAIYARCKVCQMAGRMMQGVSA